MGIASTFNKCELPPKVHTDCQDIPYGEEANLFVVKEVTSPYILEQGDSNKFLIFDYDGTGIVRIPDNLDIGTGALIANIGTGSIEVTMDGLETMRGLPLLGDPDGFMTVAKLASLLWQSSERA